MFHSHTTCRSSYKVENLKCYQVWHVINSHSALDVCREFTCEWELPCSPRQGISGLICRFFEVLPCQQCTRDLVCSEHRTRLQAEEPGSGRWADCLWQSGVELLLELQEMGALEPVHFPACRMTKDENGEISAGTICDSQPLHGVLVALWE